MDVFEMDRDRFRAELVKVTTPEFIFEHAADVYETMGLLLGQDCQDSLLREWAFEWSSEGTGRAYDEIYDRWLAQE